MLPKLMESKQRKLFRVPSSPLNSDMNVPSVTAKRESMMSFRFCPVCICSAASVWICTSNSVQKFVHNFTATPTSNPMKNIDSICVKMICAPIDSDFQVNCTSWLFANMKSGESTSIVATTQIPISVATVSMTQFTRTLPSVPSQIAASFWRKMRRTPVTSAKPSPKMTNYFQHFAAVPSSVRIASFKPGNAATSLAPPPKSAVPRMNASTRRRDRRQRKLRILVVVARRRAERNKFQHRWVLWTSEDDEWLMKEISGIG